MKRALIFVGLCVSIAAGVYWTRFAPLAVDTHLAERGALVVEVFGVGRLTGRHESTLGSKISGRLARVLVDQGDRVRTGQVMAQLDDRDLTRQVEVEQARLAAAKSAVERSRAVIARGRAVLESTRRNHDRFSDLVGRKAVSRASYDKAKEAHAVATADLRSAEAALEESTLQLAAAAKQLAWRRALLDETRIVAPHDGLVVRRYREPGDIVVPGTRVVKTVATEEMWVRAWVDETELERVRADQAARVVFHAEPGKRYAGTVVRIGREVDPETREFLVDVRVAELPRAWALGQRADIYVEVARTPDRLRIPSSLIRWHQGVPRVLVLERGRAAWRPIQLGLRAREQTEVLEGLQRGEPLIKARADGAEAVRPGRRVVPR